MKIRLSDHFTVKRLLRFTLPSIVMMIFTSIYGVVDGIFVSNFVGKTPFAAVNFIFLAVFFGYSQGMAPVVSYHFGAENTGELKSLLKKSLVLIAIASVSMFLLAEALGPAFSSVFVFDIVSVLWPCHFRLRLLHRSERRGHLRHRELSSHAGIPDRCCASASSDIWARRDMALYRSGGAHSRRDRLHIPYR